MAVSPCFSAYVSVFGYEIAESTKTQNNNHPRRRNVFSPVAGVGILIALILLIGKNDSGLHAVADKRRFPSGAYNGPLFRPNSVDIRFLPFRFAPFRFMPFGLTPFRFTSLHRAVSVSRKRQSVQDLNQHHSADDSDRPLQQV